MPPEDVGVKMNLVVTASPTELDFAACTMGELATFQIRFVVPDPPPDATSVAIAFKVRSTRPPRYSVEPHIALAVLEQQRSDSSWDGTVNVQVRLRETIPLLLDDDASPIDKFRIDAVVTTKGGQIGTADVRRILDEGRGRMSSAAVAVIRPRSPSAPEPATEPRESRTPVEASNNDDPDTILMEKRASVEKLRVKLASAKRDLQDLEERAEAKETELDDLSDALVTRHEKPAVQAAQWLSPTSLHIIVSFCVVVAAVLAARFGIHQFTRNVQFEG